MSELCVCLCCFVFVNCRYLVHHSYASYQHHSKMDESSDECYRSINHAERMMRKMESYMSKRQLCDVTLLAGHRQIPAHRIVLSAASDYFSAMFTNDVREATQDEIKMKDVDPDALASLVQYMYTGKINSIVINNRLSTKNVLFDRVASGQGKVRENNIFSKSVKSQGI